jgi:hypothetical protein
MEEIKLYTKDAGYVTTVTVAFMRPKPEVIQWGSRFFVRQLIIRNDVEYMEGLVVVCIDEPRGE